MPGKDERPDDEIDDLELETRVNLRDYPSTGLVVLGAVTSGLAWMLYRWLGRKKAAKQSDSEQPVTTENVSSDAAPKSE